jgi:hypothetical protein
MDEPKKSSAISKFISELRRRRVIRVVAIYAVVGWIIIEVASTVLPNLNLPEWTARLITILILLGFPITVIMAWVFDIGPGGVEKTPEVAAAATPATADAAPTPDSAQPPPRLPQQTRRQHLIQPRRCQLLKLLPPRYPLPLTTGNPLLFCHL